MLIIKKSNAMLKLEFPIKIPLIPSTAYVRGLINTNGDNQEGKLFVGKSDPERKNNGNIKKLPIN